MRFCQSFMTELYRHIGQTPTCPPATSAWAAARSATCSASTSAAQRVHRRAHRQGPDLRRLPGPHRGHRLRPVLLRRQDAQARRHEGFKGKNVVVSGSGNVAIYACQKATALGAKVVAMSDSNGYIYDPTASTWRLIKELKEVERGASRNMPTAHPQAKYHEGCRGIWRSPATSPCPAPPRTSSTRIPPRPSSKTAASPWRGRQYALHPRGGGRHPGRGLLFAPPRPPTPAAWPPPLWR
jgi:glutamate dehydrogenase (NADP+)